MSDLHIFIKKKIFTGTQIKRKIKFSIYFKFLFKFLDILLNSFNKIKFLF